MTKMIPDKRVLELLITFNFIFFNAACAGGGLVNEPERAGADTTMSTSNKQGEKTNENIVTGGNISPQPKQDENKNAVAGNREYLITNTSLGKVRIGMQMKEIKKVYPDSKFKIVTSSLDGVTSEIEVTRESEKLFSFTTENFSDVEETEMPAETDKVFFLVTDNPRFATAQGVKVGQNFGEAEKIYGKPEFFSQQPADFVSFANAAVESVVFYSVQDAAGKPDKKYSPGAKITHIGLGKNTK